MKKKVLTLLMAAALAVTSVSVVFAVDSPNAGDVELEETITDSAEDETDVEADVEADVVNPSVGVQEETTTQNDSPNAGDVELDDVVVEGLEDAGLDADTVLVVDEITEDDPEYELVEEFLTKELSGVKKFVADLKLMSGMEIIEGQLKGFIKITMPVFEELKDAKKIDVYRVEDDETINKIATADVIDGKFSFETDHFSIYIFAEATVEETTAEETTAEETTAEETTAEETTAEETTGAEEDGPGTGDSTSIAIYVVMAVAALGVIVLALKKKVNA